MPWNRRHLLTLEELSRAEIEQIHAVARAFKRTLQPGGARVPALAIYRGTSVVAENDDWGGGEELAATFRSVGAFTLSSTTSRDSALLVTLAPGSYTAQLTGVGNTTGVALIEVYEVP